MLPRAVSLAFQTDKPLAAYGPLAALVEAHGFDGVSVYHDLLYQPAWLPLLEIARHTRRVKIGPAAAVCSRMPFTRTRTVASANGSGSSRRVSTLTR